MSARPAKSTKRKIQQGTNGFSRDKEVGQMKSSWLLLLLGVLTVSVPAWAVGEADGTAGLGMPEWAGQFGFGPSALAQQQNTVGQTEDAGVGLMAQIRTALTEQPVPEAPTGLGVGTALQERMAAQEAARPDGQAVRTQLQQRLAGIEDPGPGTGEPDPGTGDSDPTADQTPEQPEETPTHPAAVAPVYALGNTLQARMAAQNATQNDGSALHAQLQEHMADTGGAGLAAEAQEQTRARVMGRLAMWQ